MPHSVDAKKYFETGDYPSGAQFAEVFDWLRWKDESLAIDDVSGLADILNALSTPIQKLIVGVGQTHINYTVPTGFANSKIYIVPYSTCVTTVTDMDAPKDIYSGISPDDDITPGNGLECDVSVFAPATERHIRVGPLPVGSIVYIIKTKIF